MRDVKTDAAVIRRYHERTKHHPEKYARSLGYMDWANQPVPFRTYGGAAAVSLPLLESDPEVPYLGLYRGITEGARPLNRERVSALLELSMGLSAWKSVGGNRWALRMNPSSGNLHPTECYLLLPKVVGIPPSIAHYHPYRHALEIQASMTPTLSDGIVRQFGGGGFGIVLTSVLWREAWKYGERAFRYTQHDVGHALGALRFAANLFGFQMTLLCELSDREAGILVGFDRVEWPSDEEEHVDLVAWIHPAGSVVPFGIAPDIVDGVSALPFSGIPNRLSDETVRWDVAYDAARGTEKPRTEATSSPRRTVRPLYAPSLSDKGAAAIIRQRRSAQMFDGETSLPRDVFFSMLDKTIPRNEIAPFDAWPLGDNIDLLLFVHRVEALVPGLYLLSRDAVLTTELKAQMRQAFVWRPVSDNLPLFLLEEGDMQALAAGLSCQQDIAGDSAFSLGMIARFDGTVAATPWRYRSLFWEAGLIGHVLYLEAEAHGVRGTGIGCYFDDIVHQLLGLEDRAFQSLYHFTVGTPVADRRLSTFSAYHHLGFSRPSE